MCVQGFILRLQLWPIYLDLKKELLNNHFVISCASDSYISLYLTNMVDICKTKTDKFLDSTGIVIIFLGMTVFIYNSNLFIINS